MIEIFLKAFIVVIGIIFIYVFTIDSSIDRNRSPSSSYSDIIIESSNHQRRLQAIGPNYAPSIPINTNICNKSKLWGRAHHGGWEICEDKNFLPETFSDCIVYSYGLGADWSFDNAAEDSGCEVHGFDPTGKLWRDGMHGVDYSRIDYAKQYPSSRKHFHNYGLGAASRIVYPIASGNVLA